MTYHYSEESARELLTGFPRDFLIQLLKMPYTAVRKYLAGEPLPKTQRETLNAYLQTHATITVIQEQCHDSILHFDYPNVESWMETPLSPLPNGFTITPFSLYLQGYATLLPLLACAKSGEELIEILDAYLPEWRDTRSDWEVFLDGDGQRSIRLREPDLF